MTDQSRPQAVDAFITAITAFGPADSDIAAAVGQFDTAMTAVGGDPSRAYEADDPVIVSLAEDIFRNPQAVAGLARLVMANDDEIWNLDMVLEQIEHCAASATFTAVGAWIDSACESAENFMDSTGGFAGPLLVIDQALRGGRASGPGRFRLACVLKIAAGPDHGQTTCWDVLDARVADRHIAVIAACVHLAPLDRVFRAAPAPFAPGPLFAYHPMRYGQTRDYSRLVREFEGRTMSSDGLNRVSQAIQGEYNARIGDLPRRWAPPGTAMLAINREITQFEAFQRFRHNGRAIFDLDHRLVALFGRTTIADVPLDLIRLPYAALYLHFAGLDGCTTPEGWQLSGAYVHEVSERDAMEIVMTWSPPAPALALEWPQRPEPLHKQSFVGDTRHMDAGQAMDRLYGARAIALDHERYEAHAERATAAAAIEDEIFPSSQGLGVRRLAVTTKDRSTYEKAELDSLQPMAAQAMAVVINALLYLTMYPDDRDEIWPKGTPVRLARQADNEEAPPKARRRAETRLAQMGYRRVHLCGREIRMHDLPGPPGQGAARATHWRRGHWRRQPHGPGASQRRLIWVMPTFVGQAGDEALGHLYMTS